MKDELHGLVTGIGIALFLIVLFAAGWRMSHWWDLQRLNLVCISSCQGPARADFAREVGSTSTLEVFQCFCQTDPKVTPSGGPESNGANR